MRGSPWRFFKNFPGQKCWKNRKIDDLGVFGPGKRFPRRFGRNPTKNRPKTCLGGDFLGQNKIFNVWKFFKKNQGFLQKAKVTCCKGNILHAPTMVPGPFLGVSENKLQIRFDKSKEIIKIFSDYVSKI